MIGVLPHLFDRGPPVVSEARPADAPLMAALHGASFNRGWSEDEFERFLLDRGIVAHRAMVGRQLVGFIISRLISGEAEILSVAVAAKRRSRGLARQMLHLHLRRLAGLGAKVVFLEVDEGNEPACRLYHRAGFLQAGRREGYYRDHRGKVTAALILRCELP
jgi:[ribosomal protein S18]-alanine N-acetyltransferase